MKKFVISAVVLLLIPSTGCVSIKVGTKADASAIQLDGGLANGYASIEGVREYDRTIMDLDVFKTSSHSEEFEVVSFELWPLVGFGVGLAGARVQALFLDVGFGCLFYNPRSPSRHKREVKKEEPQAEEARGEDVEEDDKPGEDEDPDSNEDNEGDANNQ